METSNLKNLLYVEDDHDLLEVVCELLEKTVNFTGVCTEAEARQKIQEMDFDIIILDLKLAEGYFCWNLVKDLHRYDIPVIIYSAYELPLEYKKYVYVSLVKSKSTYEELLASVNAGLEHAKPKERIE